MMLEDFISQRSKENLKSLTGDNERDKKSNESDYDEDKDQLEEEQEENGKITGTINQVSEKNVC